MGKPAALEHEVLDQLPVALGAEGAHLEHRVSPICDDHCEHAGTPVAARNVDGRARSDLPEVGVAEDLVADPVIELDLALVGAALVRIADHLDLEQSDPDLAVVHLHGPGLVGALTWASVALTMT